MRQMVDRGLFPRNGDWKSFIDEALESLIIELKTAPDHDFKDRVNLFRDFYTYKIMGLVPLPLSTLESLLEKSPEIAQEMVPVYLSLFKHSFSPSDLGSNSPTLRDYLHSLRRFFMAITPVSNQNLVIKENGLCGTLTIFASILGKQSVERLYLPLLEQILDQMKVDSKSVKWDNVTIDAQFCVPIKDSK
ncbi:hypothetical protein DFR87_02540 [Metallosphaera hakonensis JCM 8857 = DSM 7519]|uniref:Uncharacterized protein n=2 Tax=Metallosphaera hakonensis TaxID=79601 RepID=A0A2U9IWR1_9CREN|nr:hypothetical protein DFR87_02540 [Metallosphaera hakonensis JCM 8857 = DSM 7519]